MAYTLYYSFDEHYNDAFIFERDFKFTIEENFNDLFEFEFENKYHRKYNYFTWFLEPGAKELYRELESLWQLNSLDYYKYLQNLFFKEWIKEKYYNEALEQAYQQHINYRNTYENLSMAEYAEIYADNFEV